MKNDINADSCRICLTKTKKLRSLYKPIDEGDEPPNKMLLLITGIKVEKLDEYEMLPKNICKNCELSLSMAFEFRDNALKTNKILTEYIAELYGNENNVETKLSVSICRNKFEGVTDVPLLDCEDSQEVLQNVCNDDNNYSAENYEEELNETDEGENDYEEKQNPSDEESYNQSVAYFHINNNDEHHDTDSNMNHNYFEQHQESSEDEEDTKEQEKRISDEQEDYEYTQDQLEIIPAEDETYSEDQKDFSDEIHSKKPKRKKFSNTSTKNNGHKSEINLTQHMTLIPRRGRRPTKNTDQNGHICDICGNVFSKRGRMMEHRQRHDKECRFCCEICEKKFLTRELLRKHMFSHSGGKPLKCGYCSRTFYYESVRKAHEAVHKGLRPFVCDICGKGFGYAHALKKHKLIHAEIKLYRCEYCHKDFRLQHHMKQHELTKLHQNAVRFAKGVNTTYEEEGDDMKGGKQLEEDILYIEEIADDNLIVNSI